MVLNTQSYMWDGLDWVGYLLGPTLRAPYGANNLILKEEMILDQISLGGTPTSCDGLLLYIIKWIYVTMMRWETTITSTTNISMNELCCLARHFQRHMGGVWIESCQSSSEIIMHKIMEPEKVSSCIEASWGLLALRGRWEPPAGWPQIYQNVRPKNQGRCPNN